MKGECILQDRQQSSQAAGAQKGQSRSHQSFVTWVPPNMKETENYQRPSERKNYKHPTLLAYKGELFPQIQSWLIIKYTFSYHSDTLGLLIFQRNECFCSGSSPRWYHSGTKAWQHSEQHTRYVIRIMKRNHEVNSDKASHPLQRKHVNHSSTTLASWNDVSVDVSLVAA